MTTSKDAPTLEAIIEELYDYEFEEIAEYLQEADTSTSAGRKRFVKGLKGRIEEHQWIITLMSRALTLFPE